MSDTPAANQRLVADTEENRAADQERLIEQERHAAVQQERNRIAQELHDTLAQDVIAVALHLDSAIDADAPETSRRHIVRAREIARASVVEARRAVQGLRPRQLSAGSLVAALTALVGEAGADTHSSLKFHTEGTPRNLPSNVEDNVLRIAQEALTNALKHSGAAEITVALLFDPSKVRLEVWDNGKGFDSGGTPAEGGFGCTSMRERAEDLGGLLEVTSQPGEGTQVALTVTPALPQQKASLLAALASMDDAVIATDTDGRVTYLNPAAEAMTGWTSEAAAGQDVAIVYNAVDEDTGQALQRLLVDIARGGEVAKVNADILLIAKGGKQTPIQDAAAPIQDVGGHTIGVVVSFQDNTVPRDTRKALEALNVRLRSNLAETHHRVKNQFQIAAALIVTPINSELTSLGQAIAKVKQTHFTPGHAHSGTNDQFFNAKRAMVRA